jgi:hypothetical protein
MVNSRIKNNISIHSFPSGSKKNRPFFSTSGKNSKPFFQPKLTVGPVDDVYEQEADAVAEQVMRRPGNQFIQPKISAVGLQRKCTACEKEEKEKVRRKATASTTLEAPAEVHQALHSGGQTMDEGTKSFMENRFGYDFSQVKIHTGAVAAKSAGAINALAYTSGNHVVFNNGQYAPGTDSGKQLLAHELTHVVQQSSGIQPKTIQRRVIDRNVVTNNAMLTTLGLTRQEVIDTLVTADTDAIQLAQNAEDALTTQLNNARSGDPVDANEETILNEELGLSFNNPAHHNLIRQQIGRFRRVRETLESGYLRYLALGIGNVSLIGCEPAPCGDEFASSCPGNRLIVLCQGFWDTPDEQSATILHEPFHIWFHMARHAENALRRADASCFESYALRVSGRDAFASCVDHTAG